MDSDIGIAAVEAAAVVAAHCSRSHCSQAVVAVVVVVAASAAPAAAQRTAQGYSNWPPVLPWLRAGCRCMLTDRQSEREDPRMKTGKQARNQQRGNREEKRMKKAAETAVPGIPINFPPFRKRPRKKKKKKKEEPKPEIN